MRPNNRNKRNRRPRITKSPEEIRTEILDGWHPKTELGHKVKAEEITDMAQVLESGYRIMESQIVDKLVTNLEADFINIGQAKGKFGGGKRRIFRQTQKKTKEGNKPIFTVMAVVGNRDGYVGIGIGRAKETMPARDKATRNAKLRLIQIARGCGSWQCTCGEPHSIPFKVEGKEASVKVKFMPAPKGTGLAVGHNIRKVMEFAGIQNVWGKAKGNSGNTLNFVRAAINALEQTGKVKLSKDVLRKIK